MARVQEPSPTADSPRAARFTVSHCSAGLQPGIFFVRNRPPKPGPAANAPERALIARSSSGFTPLLLAVARYAFAFGVSNSWPFSLLKRARK
jgi:hypothetical protein